MTASTTASSPQRAAATPAPEAGAPVRAAGRRRRGLVFGAAGVLLAVGIVLSAGSGQLPIGPSEVIGSLVRGLGIPNAWAPGDALIEQTLWQIRFPRVVMSLLVGGLLAVAGAVMQAIFANPLAEPGVVGVSSGAAVGLSLIHI